MGRDQAAGRPQSLGGFALALGGFALALGGFALGLGTGTHSFFPGFAQAFHLPTTQTGTMTSIPAVNNGPTTAGSSTASEARLLVVDDEPNIVELLAASLRFAGFAVTTAANGTEALKRAAEVQPDLVVLDVMMPGLDGFEVVRRMRQEGLWAPVLFLTARDAVEDKITGLTLGADDYVTKPFSLGEVLARIRAILRRAGFEAEAQSARINFADIEMDEDAHEVFKNGNAVELSPTEFKLLRYFLINPGRVLSKAQILDHVWHYDFGGEATVVESYVSYLRRKIDTTEPRLLHTVRGVGYVLRKPRS